jgi:hypothetical protein
MRAATGAKALTSGMHSRVSAEATSTPDVLIARRALCRSCRRQSVSYNVQTQPGERNLHARGPARLAVHLSSTGGCYNSIMAKKTTLDDIARTLSTHGTQIRDLAAIVEKGFAAARDDIGDLRTELKGDIARVHEQVTKDSSGTAATRSASATSKNKFLAKRGVSLPAT